MGARWGHRILLVVVKVDAIFLGWTSPYQPVNCGREVLGEGKAERVVLHDRLQEETAKV